MNGSNNLVLIGCITLLWTLGHTLPDNLMSLDREFE